MKNQKIVSLLTYADRLAGELDGLEACLARDLPEFNGVHILPFFDPHDGADTGFDPDDHRAVSPALGGWDDVRRISSDREVTADLIVNHTSNQAPEFLDWLAKGDASEHAGMYLTFDTVFPNGAHEAEVTAFYRPRPGLPVTPYLAADGTRRLVWTTFRPEQVDIDLHHPAGRRYLTSVMRTLREGGVDVVRLDAVGYAVKTAGTNSFMTPQTLELLAEVVDECHEMGLQVLVEVHSHYADQLRLAGLVDLVYDFATGPCLLHATYTGDMVPLANWLELRPANNISVLDTHDGIGVVDARGTEAAAGLITDKQATEIFAVANELTGGLSSRSSVIPQFNVIPHQINATYLGALGNDLESLLALRVAQLMLPGPAHVYYAGALGLGDDEQLWLATGEGRAVNRPVLDAAGLAQAVQRPFVTANRALVKLVTTHPAMGEAYSWSCAGGVLEQRWQAEGAELHSRIVLGNRRARFELTSAIGGQERTATGVGGLSAFIGAGE